MIVTTENASPVVPGPSVILLRFRASGPGFSVTSQSSSSVPRPGPVTRGRLGVLDPECRIHGHGVHLKFAAARRPPTGRTAKPAETASKQRDLEKRNEKHQQRGRSVTQEPFLLPLLSSPAPGSQWCGDTVDCLTCDGSVPAAANTGTRPVVSVAQTARQAAICPLSDTVHTSYARSCKCTLLQMHALPLCTHAS
jgi:hypothetical protein